jgi:hypothetical protein
MWQRLNINWVYVLCLQLPLALSPLLEVRHGSALAIAEVMLRLSQLGHTISEDIQKVCFVSQRLTVSQTYGVFVLVFTSISGWLVGCGKNEFMITGFEIVDSQD